MSIYRIKDEQMIVYEDYTIAALGQTKDLSLREAYGRKTQSAKRGTRTSIRAHTTWKVVATDTCLPAGRLGLPVKESWPATSDTLPNYVTRYT